jgi:putative FmdB family regulatory protein
MPTYLYRCEHCGGRREVLKKLADLNVPEFCGCEIPMQRIICAPAVRNDYAPYDCPITGKRIEGRRAHEENLKKHGCRVFEPGETQAAAAVRKASDNALDKAVEDTAERFVHELPVEKREQLVVEMESGLDVQIARN